MRIQVLVILTVILAGCQPVQRAAFETPTPTPITIPTTSPEVQATADAVAADFNQAEAVNSLTLRASHAMERGDWAQAEEYLTEALVLNPNSPDALALRSMARYMQGDDAGAAADAAKITTADLDNPNVLILRSLMWESRGDFERALEALERAIILITAEAERAGGNPRVYVRGLLSARGTYLLRLGRTEAAFADLEEAVALSVSTADRAHALFYRGMGYNAVQDYAQARRDLEEALRLPLLPDLKQVAQDTLDHMP